MRLGVLASGRGSNAAAIFGAIRDGRLDMEPALLVCDRQGARAMDVAASFHVPLVLIERAAYPDRGAQQRAILERLTAARVELLALAGFSAILDDRILKAFEGRIFNVHPSLLPAFAGSIAPQPQAAALRAGVKLSGCSVHIATDTVDGGPIVAQAAVPVLPGDSVETLGARILMEEHRLFPQVLQWFVEGRVRLEDGRAYVDRESPGG
jgi:phosphoribosylglycinamide formyltransferase-1